jgi:hypothetical protein
MENVLPYLEDNSRISRLRKYASVFFILFITFAIPVTITQVYKTNSTSSNASVVTPTPTIPNYLITSNTPTPQTFSQATATQPTSFWTNYWWILLIVGGMVLIWMVLIILYALENRREIQRRNASL